MIIPDKKKALFYAKRDLAQIVTDVVNLENINYSVPEVQTLLDGITVGGHKIQDELITLNQIQAWKFLFLSLEKSAFALSKEYVCRLHGFVAKEEALTWGNFRSGGVTISGTSYIPPNFQSLDQVWEHMLKEAENHKDVYDKAIYLFAEMARNQFFYDGNKRTARMTMSGLLLNAGFPMINVTAKRKHEFNRVMLDYYETHNLTPVNLFLRSCLNQTILNEFTN